MIDTEIIQDQITKGWWYDRISNTQELGVDMQPPTRWNEYSLKAPEDSMVDTYKCKHLTEANNRRDFLTTSRLVNIHVQIQ